LKIVHQIEEKTMQKWECPCGYIYDPQEGDYENGVDPGTPWEKVPSDWVCPKCGAAKEDFWKAD
jgi:rubredoxin